MSCSNCQKNPWTCGWFPFGDQMYKWTGNMHCREPRYWKKPDDPSQGKSNVELRNYVPISCPQPIKSSIGCRNDNVVPSGITGEKAETSIERWQKRMASLAGVPVKKEKNGSSGRASSNKSTGSGLMHHWTCRRPVEKQETVLRVCPDCGKRVSCFVIIERTCGTDSCGHEKCPFNRAVPTKKEDHVCSSCQSKHQRKEKAHGK